MDVPEAFHFPHFDGNACAMVLVLAEAFDPPKLFFNHNPVEVPSLRNMIKALRAEDATRKRRALGARSY